MKKLDTSMLTQFARGYRFAGARLRRVRVLADGDGLAVEFGLTVMPAIKDLGTEPTPVRLKLRLDGVEEFRFQKRSNSRVGRVPDVKFGYFDGLVFVNLDAWGLQPGEVPGVHDYRASDAFAAGKVLSWAELKDGPTA